MFTHLNRSLFLSGVLAPPIIVNSTSPLYTNEFSVQMNQEINVEHLYLQGGHGKSVSEFKTKIISGKIDVTPRINESNILEPGTKLIVNSAQDYKSVLTLTSYLQPYNANITPESGPYFPTTNSLIFDICLVESLIISAKRDGDVKMAFSIKGQTDTPNTSQIPLPAEDYSVFRKLTWYDCHFYRNNSPLENLFEMEIEIKKEVDQKSFLISYPDGIRHDRPDLSAIKGVGVRFKFVEHITSLFDIFNYSFGGFSDSYNFSGNFGPINFNVPDVTLRISTQNISPDIIERTTEGFYRMHPDTPENSQFLFTIN